MWFIPIGAYLSFGVAVKIEIIFGLPVAQPKWVEPESNEIKISPLFKTSINSPKFVLPAKLMKLLPPI